MSSSKNQLKVNLPLSQFLIHWRLITIFSIYFSLMCDFCSEPRVQNLLRKKRHHFLMAAALHRQLSAKIRCRPKVWSNIRCRIHGHSGTTIMKREKHGKRANTKSPISIQLKTSGVCTITSNWRRKSKQATITHCSRTAFGRCGKTIKTSTVDAGWLVYRNIFVQTN